MFRFSMYGIVKNISLLLMFFVVGLAIYLGNFGYSNNVSHGLSEEHKNKLHVGFIPLVAECSKELSVTEEQVKVARESGKIDNMDPCLMRCIFKKVDVINDKGFFDIDKGEELVKNFLPNEEDQQKVSDVMKTCASVNDQYVSDGEKGCERSNLLYYCIIPSKA